MTAGTTQKPVAWWVPKADQFCRAAADGSRPFAAWEPLYPAPSRSYTYVSSQATRCAGCGETRHTPLRVDLMGGYVCLACINDRLTALLKKNHGGRKKPGLNGFQKMLADRAEIEGRD